ncbi:Alcohol dehydrogenase class-3-like protein [Dinothrombium tinctorium]|uniref:Alcohol dehydrogenase class-3-like protein n=1 Tax=Dinothrombium tinctorium TaxID=1965070 RepID=A0A3S3P4K4_9ACAR|nr:Alcohol dehydrogenase class-3-like protein [Dinothrombium tinctorium]RWS09637.1 Alcohol dehydrogenase class-3-like protein [Dinothrombium tinctorium]RWS11998.1 Alcohol dehydrogenase class-3-like protein [Dinothrombium tinctorium]
MNSETGGKVIKCRAAICWAPTKPLTVEEIEVEPPRAGEVRIKVIANSICHSDVFVYDGQLSGTMIATKYPCILGHEATGLVESVGDGVTSVAPGDYVITMFNASCQECVFCKNPKTNLCVARPIDEVIMADGTSRFKFNGQTIYYFGGISSLSEYTVISEFKMAKINPNARMDRVCIFACGFPTGYGSVAKIAQAEPDSSVAIWGLGTLGLLAVCAARKCKAKTIIGIVRNERKIELAKKMGCTHFVNTVKCKEESKTVADAIKELTGGIGVDYAIECVGNAACVREALESTAPWGTTVVAGICSANDKLEINPNQLLSGKKLTGTFFGGYKSKQSIPQMIDDYVDGKLDIEALFTGSVQLNEVDAAFQLLKQGKALRTVIVF